MAKPKSKLIANRAAHSVALTSDGVASRRASGSKVKKEATEQGPESTPVPALSRPVRATRRPVDAVALEPVRAEATPLSTEPAVPAPPIAKPRPAKKRVQAPTGPALSDSTQARMREMTERLQAVRQQLDDLQNKKRPARARRTT